MDNYVCASCGFRWIDPAPTGMWCPMCKIAALEAEIARFQSVVHYQEKKIAELEAIIQAMQEARAGDVTTIDEILEVKERNSDAE